MKAVPNYLSNYSELWEKDPLAANLEWFKNAKWGLFMHYGLYSQMGIGEWVLRNNAVPLPEYEKLFESFSPDNFDADFITDLALEAGMSYVNITSCHHEGFCLWKSDVEAFNSYNACKRDLIKELATACDKKGLGFFTYFTYVLNWRHPYSPTKEMLPTGRPDYGYVEERYKLTDPKDYYKYWEWSHSCIEELLEMDAPLAGMWLDIIMAYYTRPDLIPVEETYKLIRQKRPEVLISYKQGATGTEDFAAPEYHFRSQGDVYRKGGNVAAAELADKAWEINKNKHNEICMTLQYNAWGYNKNSDHRTADEVWQSLAYALKNNCNLLANVGPLPDGSIHPEDIASLQAVGKRIRENGWPTAADAEEPETPWQNKKTKANAGAQ